MKITGLFLIFAFVFMFIFSVVNYQDNVRLSECLDRSQKHNRELCNEIDCLEYKYEHNLWACNGFMDRRPIAGKRQHKFGYQFEKPGFEKYFPELAD